MSKNTSIFFFCFIEFFNYHVLLKLVSFNLIKIVIFTTKVYTLLFKFDSYIVQ